MRRLLVALILACSLLTTACQSGGATTPEGPKVDVQHAQGTTTLTANPQRIAVMDFGALDTVRALGLSDRVVALPKKALPNFLDEFRAERYADAGTLQEPNYEALNKANPDLVIVGFRSAKTYGEMSKHWPTIDITYDSQADLITGTERAARVIAAAVGGDADSKVTAKVAELRQRVEGDKAAAAQAGKGLVLMTSGGKVSMHGPQSRYSAVHGLFGVQPAKSDIKADSHGEPVSFELIAQLNPDTIFVVDRDQAIGQGGQNAMAILDNELMHTTTAWRTGHIVPLDGKRWYITVHGLDNAAAMLDEVSRGLSK